METIGIDPCMVAGTVAAARFDGRGVVIRSDFVDHPKVRRWLAKWGNPTFKTEPRHGFDQLLREAIQW